MDQIDQKLQALDLISMQIQKNYSPSNTQLVLWINNICLKLADLITNNTTKNALRNEIVSRIFKVHSAVIQECLVNQD